MMVLIGSNRPVRVSHRIVVNRLLNIQERSYGLLKLNQLKVFIFGTHWGY